MEMIKLLFLFCFIYNIHAYPTNVVESIIWKSKLIDFVVICEDDEKVMFYKLIFDTVSNLNKAVGQQFIQWKEHTLKEAISKKRYLIFVLERYQCGETAADSKGGYYVPLSISSDCNTSTNLRNLMIGLGFIYTHLRDDRDKFIEINFENIYNFNHQIYEKCGTCINSTNEAFAIYDYNSILHWPQFSIYAKNESIPIITPKQNNIQMDQTWDVKSFTEQDILIFKAIYGQ